MFPPQFPAWPLLYLAWVIPVLVAVAAATPPWQNSDEPLHMARAVQIAHGGLIGYRAWTTSGGDSDRAIYEAYKPVQHVAMHPDQRPTAAEIAQADQVPWSPQTQYTSFPNTAQYPPFFYLPDAAAYWLGRAVGLGIDRTLVAARLANAALFAAVTACALYIARRSRYLLTALLMLPMTLALACSAAQDSLMLAATALAIAILDRLTAENRPATRREYALAGICLVAVGMARPPYAGFLLAFLAAAPILTRTLLAGMAAAAALVVAWCLLVATHTSVKLGGADIARQLAFLAAHTGQIPSIIGGTLHSYATNYWVQFIGTLGWTDTLLPRGYTIFATAIVLAAAAASSTGPVRRPWAAGAGIAFSILAIFVLQYLTWTWPGQPVVTGVLGRYFIPPAMMLCLALPHCHARAHLYRRVAILGLILMAVVTPIITLHALHQRYGPPG
jgi:uncharacterized membrane protein